MFRSVGRGAAALGGAVIIALAAITPSSAHVTITPTNTAEGSYTLLTVGVPHGCDGSATVEVAIQIPEEFVAVTPGMNYGWTVEKVYQDLTTPVTDSHGNEITERVESVVYTAKEPLLDGFYDSFVLSVRLPEGSAGETLYFPAVQTCEEGEAAWIQIPEAGESGDDLEYPAPSVTVTEPEADGD
jgi:periplasmic copper chaperone A